MKKYLMTMAVVAASMMTMSAFAQTVRTGNGDSCKKAKEGKCVVSRQCSKSDSTCRKAAYNPFEGLNLTEQQQARLQAIPRPGKVAATAVNGARGAGVQQNVPAKKAIRRDIRANYLKEIQQVLTPEQYVKYLENYYISAKPGKQAKPGEAKGIKQGHKRHAQHNGSKSPKISEAEMINQTANWTTVLPVE